MFSKIEQIKGWKRVWFVSNFIVFFYYYFYWYVDSSLTPNFFIHTSEFLDEFIFLPIFNSIFDFPLIKDIDEIPFIQQQTFNLRGGLSFLLTYVFYSIIFYKTGKWLYKGFKNQ